MNIVTYFTRFESPVGGILLRGDGKKLTDLHLLDYEHSPTIQSGWIEDGQKFSKIQKQLEKYFAGELQNFDLVFEDDIETQGTAFQKKVWFELYKIPYGETISYKELARRVGSPKAVRAVGSANGRNPISIIIPCHRSGIEAA